MDARPFLLRVSTDLLLEAGRVACACACAG